jgi:DNA-binding response OmpR family regulator
MVNMGESVLVVDGGGEGQGLLLADMQSAGLKTMVADDVADAYAVIFTQDIALVLLGTISGQEGEAKDFLATIRKTYTATDLPIIVMSPDSSSEDIAQFLKSGANDYFAKPINSELALARVKIQLRVRRVERMLSNQTVALLASAKLASLGQMASGIVHEIKNPLTIIQGMNEILGLNLAEENFDREVAKKCVVKVDVSIERMRRIIKSIQAYSHPGEPQEPFLQAKLEDLVDDTLIYCTDRVRMAGIRLTVSPCPSRTCRIASHTCDALSRGFIAACPAATQSRNAAYFSRCSTDGSRIASVRPESEK